MKPETRTRLLVALALAGLGVVMFYPDSPFSDGPMGTSDLRDAALKLCALYLPCDRGDAHWREICHDFGGSGTTCGYLPAWMWFRLGARDPRLVNYSDAAAGLVYRQAMNISDVVNGGKSDGMWHLYHPNASPEPEPGDVLYFGVVGEGGGITKEHVAVLESFPSGGTGTLVTWDLGHSGNPEGSRSERTMQNGVVQFLGSNKTLVGFDSLAALPVVAPADLTDHTLVIA